MSDEIEKKIQRNIQELPARFVKQMDIQWQLFLEKVDNQYFTGQWDLAIIETLPKVWVCSEAVARWCVRYPQWLSALNDLNLKVSHFNTEDFKSSWFQQSKAIESEADFYQALRQFRNVQMLRIIWRDICGWSDLQNTVMELSVLAEVCINVARQFYAGADSAFTKEFGIPVNAQEQQQELLIIAMGKLGAHELNLSSDIDLIFSYRDEGNTINGQKSVNNSDYFSRLGKKIIASLNNTTEDGFVFRVDMRLRPFGDGGALVSSFNALENYYQIHGREWERYAMIKARVVTGTKENTEELMQLLRPFIYRRYMDYGAYESMRDLKAMIIQQVKRKGMQGNVKLGAGGIREVEFIAQVFQLIRGGRDQRYQQPELRVVLQLLKQEKRLPEYVVEELLEAYDFLRNTEHRIQAFRDQQTHQLPEQELEQERLAYSMGYNNWNEFSELLSKHREKVHTYFDQVFEAPQTESEQGNDVLKQIWQQHLSEETLLQAIQSLGYNEPESILKILADLRDSKAFQTRTTHGQNRLNRLMPMVIGAVAQVENADTTLQRIIDIIEQVAKRSVYMSLLIENPLALSQLVKLCAQSPWVSRYISRHPLLLDDLLDPRSLYMSETKESLNEECQNIIREGNNDDEEFIADSIRHFKQSNILRVVAADLANVVSLMRISDYLSWIAEIVLEITLEQAWQYMLKRHGYPQCVVNEKVCQKGFAIIGYGKLGGYELGYGSDLDMVFLHGAKDDNAMTVAPKGTEQSETIRLIANSVFFTRLGQRLIHLLTTRTAAGRLYEVDMRLRPDGASGMLVSSLKSYEKYQQEKAWVWEHQALVRARAVAGDPLIVEQFNIIRNKTLMQKRNIDDLRSEVIKMREKMRTALSKQTEELFDVKHSQGGIVDIEFMVQFAVLAWANDYPQLCNFTDNIRLLAMLEEIGKLSGEEAQDLMTAYKRYRQRLHRLALQEKKGLVLLAKYDKESQRVQAIWNSFIVKAS